MGASSWVAKITGPLASTGTQYGADITDMFIDWVTSAGSEVAAIKDSLIQIVNASDITKVVKFSCALITSSTERTVSWPDKDITPGDDVVGLHEDVIYADSMSDADGVTNASAEYVEEFTTTNKLPVSKMKFDPAADECCFFKWRPSKLWDPTTAIKIKALWSNDAGLTTETIELEVSAVAVGNDDAIDAAPGTAVALTDTWLAQGDIHETAFSAALTIAGSPAKGDYVIFKIMRDVSADNLTGDLALLAIIIQHTIDAATAV